MYDIANHGEQAEPHPLANAEQPAAAQSSNNMGDVNELLQQLELAGHVSLLYK